MNRVKAFRCCARLKNGGVCGDRAFVSWLSNPGWKIGISFCRTHRATCGTCAGDLYLDGPDGRLVACPACVPAQTVVAIPADVFMRATEGLEELAREEVAAEGQATAAEVDAAIAVCDALTGDELVELMPDGRIIVHASEPANFEPPALPVGHPARRAR